MKKLFLAMIVCAGFCACSNDDVIVTTSPSEALGEGVAYITVNIKDVNSGTRASDGGFAYGTEAEQTVNNAYFYLYDEDGEYVAYGSLGSVDGTAASGEPANIEWNSGTVVAIWGLTDPKVPKMMVTVLNQPSNFSGVNKDLATLETELAGTPYGESGNLVMSTSTYMSSSAVVNYTTLEESNFAPEPIDIDTDYATGSNYTAVNVYVERLASKVGVNDGITGVAALATGIYPVSDEVLENFPMGAPTPSNTAAGGGLGIQLLGFDVDCVARDAYVSKHIDTNWNFTGFTWNDILDSRSYWAESPNYDVKHTYPTSSNGNTDADEDTTPLDGYLRYVSLENAVDLGGATYCGENTNTVDVLEDATNTGITNVLVKAQFGDYNPNGTPSQFTGIDLVEYHGEYYTAVDFTQKCVDDVVDYDFTIVVDEVINALKEKYQTATSYLEDLNGAIVKDHIYKSDANTNHKYGIGVTGPTSVTPFGGEMLSLYNAYDGNVKIYYNMTTQPQWGDGSSSYTDIDPTLAAKYPASDIVYNADVDLDDYDFWFHVDQEKFEDTSTGSGLKLLGLLYEVNGEYYMPIDNSISFTTEAMGDTQFTGGHTYTTRNFLLRTITVEADGIDNEFGSLYPNYYKDGLMYYHVPIEHLNTAGTEGALTEGEYGVVRNHYYNVTITSLKNLGRGIAVEDEVIVPQPEIPYYYLGATIDILSWKMVNQEVGF